MTDDFSTRDRVLLAFANLASYGVVAVTGVAGSCEDGHRELRERTRNRPQFTRDDYVFSLQDEEAHAFDPGGQAIAPLTLYMGGAAIGRAVREALSQSGVATVTGADSRTLVIPT